MGTAILLFAWVAMVLTRRGHGRAALAVVCLHALASVRLGLLLAGGDWWSWVLLAPAMGLVMALGTPTRPGGEATARVIGALPAVVWAAGALFLGWLIQWLVGNAVTVEARLELAGFGMGALEPVRFWSWLTAALCAGVLIAAAVHVLTGRPSRTVLCARGRGQRGRDAGGRAVQRVARPLTRGSAPHHPVYGSARPTLVACVTRSRIIKRTLLT